MQKIRVCALAVVSIVVFAGCSQNVWPSVAAVAPQLDRNSNVKGHAATSGLYVSSGGLNSDVWGFPAGDRGNGPPTCSLSGFDYVNNIAVDGKGNLMVPSGQPDQISIFQGPRMCGAGVGAIRENYGPPWDAAGADAVNGKIAVAIFSGTNNNSGGIALCTLAAGCTSKLTNPLMWLVYGVAMATNGDCWGSGSNKSGGTLVYFAGCSGAGVAATGRVRHGWGGLDIDSNGNLVSIDSGASQLVVYSGCNPKCKLVGGPFELHCCPDYGHLNKDSTQFAAARGGESVDIYSYSATALTYEYSITNGITGTTRGAAYNPRSKE